MKIIDKNGGFQGDLAIIPVGEIPATAKEQPKEQRVVLAHSETGHHHAVDNNPEQSVVLFATDNPRVAFLRVDSDHADVVHHRDWHTHETWRLPRGSYQINRQEELRPDGFWTPVAD